MTNLQNKLIQKVYVKETKKTSLKLIQWMQTERLLKKKMKCRKRMKMVSHNCTDGYMWKCPKPCRKARSIRTGSLFSKSHATLFTWMKYIHRFAQGLRMRQVDMIQDGIAGSSTTLSKMSRRLRRKCIKSIKRISRKGQRVGGVNVVIHIDESKFCHKRKYARGRIGNTSRRKTWVFGILEIRDDSRRPVLRLVKRRNKQTLLPIIKRHVKPQSIIISDEWRAYSTLSQAGYVHHAVNHSVNFVDPATGNHTQHTERAWRTYKNEVWRLRGNRSEKSLKNHLKFIEWTYWLGRNHRKGVLGRLLKDIRVA